MFHNTSTYITLRCSITPAHTSNIFEGVAYAKSNSLHLAQISYVKRTHGGAKVCCVCVRDDGLSLPSIGVRDTNPALIAFGIFYTY
jgi:hypothetical protein